MAKTTLLDIAKLNLGDEEIGLIEESLEAAPELRFGLSRTIAGTSYRTSVRTGLPTVAFREANKGQAPTKSAFKNVLVEAMLLSARIEADKAVADAYDEGAESWQMIEAQAVIESAFRKVGTQFYYGTSADTLGFPGLAASYDSSNMEVSAGASSAKTSVWFVRFGLKDVHFVLGRNRVMDPLEWRLGDGTDADGNKYPAWITDLTSWVGLQVGNANSIARIANVGTGAGESVTSSLMYEALSKFPQGYRPNAVFMNSRSAFQLQNSYTTVQYNSSGNAINTFTPPPVREFDGLPVFVSDQISNDE